MNSTYNITSAQKKLPALIRNLGKEGVIGITVHNQTNAFLISPERMEAIAETMQVLGNKKAIAAIDAYQSNTLTFTNIDDV